MSGLSEYCRGSDERLTGCGRPLNLLYIFNGAAKMNEIKNSPWKSTLTELHLGYSIENENFRYIGDLRNLKILSLAICLYAFDEEIAPLKNLYNLEELRIDYGGEDCNLTNDGMISLFTLPDYEPEKAFPYKLKHLGITDFQGCSSNLLKTINKNCPYLRTLDLSFSEYMDDDALPFIVANFKHLAFLDLSNLGECYKDEVWSNLSDGDLPELRFLKIHGNEADIGNLQRLNLKRPKLLISTKSAYVINWTVNENGYVFHDTFEGDIKALENDLRQIEGLRDFKVT
uniref:FBD domain-containing protein n=1 Tax=Setaria digitata TaxID=48799 RepID=A0A915PIE4_9BILA